MCFRATLFYEDFSLQDAIDKFENYKNTDPQSNMLVYVNCPDERKPNNTS